MRAFIIYTASTAADINFSWTVPTGSTLAWTSSSPATNVTSAGGSIARQYVNQVGSSPAGGSGTTSSNKSLAMLEGILLTDGGHVRSAHPELGAARCRPH